MRPLRFVALGDSLTEGVGDPVGDSWRGWAALLAGGLAPAHAPAEFTNLSFSGAQTRDVLERQTPDALDLRPDVVSVVIGVNDTLRYTFDIPPSPPGSTRSTRPSGPRARCCSRLPDPGSMLRLPGALARPLARRQRAVNTVVHALSERHGAVHLHAEAGTGSTTGPCGARTGCTRGSAGTGNSPCASTRCSEEGVATGIAPRNPSSLRPPARPACGGSPPPERAGWRGDAPICCRNCSPSPQPRCATRRGGPAPGWT
ncbi:SGNH/GDSL hydrolase family protein [Streptomyces sp. T1317-0309]|nr:SGNH/GDSL hydrolase family protein [Streptomyces sp. T1317-0309]